MPTPEALSWAASRLPGCDPSAERPPQSLPGAGSDRRLTRIFRGSGAVILVENPCPPSTGPNENDSFVYLAGHLHRRRLPVPEVLAYDRERGVYLMEDLGDEDLLSFLGGEPGGEEVKGRYLEAAGLLVRFQVDGLAGFDPRRCHSPPRYDRKLMTASESGYFQRELLEGLLGLSPPPSRLAGEFAALADEAAGAGADFLLHRDYQSTNLKLARDRLWVIDFQGARLGPPQYDLAALIYDPYAALDGQLREEVCGHYLDLFTRRTGRDRESFLDLLPSVAAHRLMQALGAYAFLGHRRGKTPFLRHIPSGLRLLGDVLSSFPSERFPALRECLSLARERLEEG